MCLMDWKQHYHNQPLLSIILIPYKTLTRIGFASESVSCTNKATVAPSGRAPNARSAGYSQLLLLGLDPGPERPVPESF